MPILNDADAVYNGSTLVNAVYRGTNRVWPNMTQEDMAMAAAIDAVTWQCVYWASDVTGKADGTGFLNGELKDRSGNNLHAVAPGTSGVNVPNYMAASALYNGRPSVFYDGGGALKSPGLFTALPIPNTIVLVGHADVDADRFFSGGSSNSSTREIVRGSADTFFARGVQSGGAITHTTPADSNPHAFVAVFNGASSRFRIDGVEVTGNTGASGATQQLRLGYRSSQVLSTALTGEMPFIGLTPNELTTQEIEDLENALSTYYNLSFP